MEHLYVDDLLLVSLLILFVYWQSWEGQFGLLSLSPSERKIWDKPVTSLPLPTLCNIVRTILTCAYLLLHW